LWHRDRGKELECRTGRVRCLEKPLAWEVLGTNRGRKKGSWPEKKQTKGGSKTLKVSEYNKKGVGLKYLSRSEEGDKKTGWGGQPSGMVGSNANKPRVTVNQV